MTSVDIIHESLNTGTRVGVLTIRTFLLPGHVTLGSVSLEVLRLQGEMSHSEGPDTVRASSGRTCCLVTWGSLCQKVAREAKESPS